MVFPGSQVITAEMSKGRNAGAYFGMWELSWGVGGGIGNYLGSWLVKQPGGFEWSWYVYAAIGLICCILLVRLRDFDKKY
ncbi:MFS transporter, DHA1 family, multidrug resistance protein [Thermoflavimicrobium dichotomicum]|uniref:MFS transporter, DHA1 family, multidrug resistance protein n=2 Tax=Thermoflavimicrobium dichotomicum TaxID=46223 RepID=A0A1I3TGQ2_9BACL|nr:MFS transporter, DHA1 family, multidrug resistance protein [Thermoflavimicrobium dichotomicum]